MNGYTQTQTRRVKPVILRHSDNGTILGTAPRNPQQQKIDFWRNVKKSNASNCWEWSGGKASHETGRNYGVAWLFGKKWKAHRAAWVFEFGPIPEGVLVCHKCDNPPCCNPSHLFLGSNKDNAQDCINKGRGNKEKGEDRYNAKLTQEEVREIRKRYKPRCKMNSGIKLAGEFGVGVTMISAIVNRKKWTHI